MKTFRVYIIIFTIILPASQAFSQTSQYNNFYLGFGTGVASYLGGYFGNAYSLKVLSDYSDDYYYDEYYYDSYYSSYNETTIWSPLFIDITGGFSINDNLSLEVNSTFLFAFNGLIDPQFVTGSNGNRDYIDRNSRSSLYAVPLSAALKFHSEDEYGSGFFLKIGPAFQYTSEEYDRIREYYDYEKYYSYSSFVYLGTVSETRWLPGFTTSIGVQFALSGDVTSFTELAYSYFNISGDGRTALALDRAKEAQLFALNTKVFFSF